MVGFLGFLQRFAGFLFCLSLLNGGKIGFYMVLRFLWGSVGVCNKILMKDGNWLLKRVVFRKTNKIR